MAKPDLTTVTITVTARLRHVEGSKADADALKEELIAVVEADGLPTDLLGLGDEADGEYEVYDYTVT
jgi:hypothetical protein